jgi:hypothetical protein
MRKIIVGARISMDGVMQAPSGPAEDLPFASVPGCKSTTEKCTTAVHV